MAPTRTRWTAGDSSDGDHAICESCSIGVQGSDVVPSATREIDGVVADTSAKAAPATDALIGLLLLLLLLAVCGKVAGPL